MALVSVRGFDSRAKHAEIPQGERGIMCVCGKCESCKLFRFGDTYIYELAGGESERMKIKLEAIQVEYSCSPGGVDTWELYSSEGELLYSSENFDVFMRYVMKNFAEYEITLKITSLKWYHKQLERESA